MEHLESAAAIKRILDQRRAKGHTVTADLIEDTLRRILTPASGLVGTVPGYEGYVGIFSAGGASDFRFVYVNFSGRVDFDLPRDQIEKYEPSGYARWRGDLEEDHHRAAVDLTDAVSVLVAVELATLARTFSDDGNRISVGTNRPS